MIDELIIHVGNHKTASTSMQKCLREKSYEVDDDVYYPETVGGPVQYNHNYYIRSLRTEHQTDRFGHLLNLLRNTDRSKAVISSAAYAYFHGSDLKDHVEEYYRPLARNIRLIKYIRPHLSSLVSSYTELVRIGLFSDTIYNLLESPMGNRMVLHHDNPRSLKRYFGESVEIVPMIPEALIGNDPVTDILHRIFRDHKVKIKRSHTDNIMVSAQHLSVIKELQASNFGSEDDKKGYGYEYSRSLSDIWSPENSVKFQISKASAKKFSVGKNGLLEDALRCDRFLFDQPYLEKALYDFIGSCPAQDVSLKMDDYDGSHECLEKMKLKFSHHFGG
jgi:hypothetical protein